MSNQLTDLLARLAELAPDVCRRGFGQLYTIGDYRFSIYGNQLIASHEDDFNVTFTGRPALAWLEDAVKGAIRSRGWGYRTQMPADSHIHTAKVYRLPDGIFSSSPEANQNDAESLLAAFVAALTEER